MSGGWAEAEAGMVRSTRGRVSYEVPWFGISFWVHILLSRLFFFSKRSFSSFPLVSCLVLALVSSPLDQRAEPTSRTTQERKQGLDP